MTTLAVNPNPPSLKVNILDLHCPDFVGPTPRSIEEVQEGPFMGILGGSKKLGRLLQGQDLWKSGLKSRKPNHARRVPLYESAEVEKIKEMTQCT